MLNSFQGYQARGRYTTSKPIPAIRSSSHVTVAKVCAPSLDHLGRSLGAELTVQLARSSSMA